MEITKFKLIFMFLLWIAFAITIFSIGLYRLIVTYKDYKRTEEELKWAKGGEDVIRN
jgi:hypothetical protein